MAFITSAVLEGIRDGRRVEDLISWGATLLTPDDVMDGVPEKIHDIQVEGTFPDGTNLVTIHDPIRGAVSRVLPGAYLPAEGEIELNAGRPITSLTFP